MTIVAWVFALIAAGIHILVWAWEGLLIHRPFVHQGVFGVPASDLPAIRLWAFGLSFYNLFLGLGLVLGVGAWATGSVVVGRTMVVYICVFMVLCGVVLFVADRLGFGRVPGKHIGGAFGQAAPPLIALGATALT